MIERTDPGQASSTNWNREKTMPRITKMNGLFAHSYAALAVATVLAFPSPSALIDSIQPQPSPTETRVELGFDRAVALSENSNPWQGVQEIERGLETCIRGYSDRVIFPNPDCSRLIQEAKRIKTASFRTAGSSEFEEKIKLAGALQCRADWSNSVKSKRQFDINECLDRFVRVADAS